MSTCSHILKTIQGNGKAVAIAYPLDKTGWKHPDSYQNMNKSSYVQSINAMTYQPRQIEHAGLIQKKLAPYNPNSYRSRLPIATVVMPYKNSS